MDSFWAQDVINEWNDEFSPKKAPKPSKPLFTKDNNESPKKSPTKVDRLAKEAKKAFTARKHDLAESFLQELDTTITKGEISTLSASTGGVKIIWSKKLSTTAGRANWKRETIRSASSFGIDGKPLITYRHHAAIELAEKVIDDEDRLLNVIAHEFCHLANFMVSGIKTNPHGKEFKAWAKKVSVKFGHRGIEVTTKHSYEIDYKYVWECENCGVEFKRHSKSIDTTRHRCGVCKSLLVQTKPVPRGGKDGEKGVLGEYQIFVKENMKIVRSENPMSPQKEIMGLVGKRYKERKAAKDLGGNVEKELVTVDIEEVVESKESTPVEDDGVGDVVRKLDFLDLTSP
jgi:predicted SprT family Zn-dependent metalloprotease